MHDSFRNPVGAARCAGVRIPPSPPRRRGRHIVRGDFFTKVTSHSFCRGSFPNRNRCAGLAVGRPPCGRCFYDDSGNLNGSGEMDSALAKASPVAKIVRRRRAAPPSGGPFPYLHLFCQSRAAPEQSEICSGVFSTAASPRTAREGEPRLAVSTKRRGPLWLKWKNCVSIWKRVDFSGKE